MHLVTTTLAAIFIGGLLAATVSAQDDKPEADANDLLQQAGRQYRKGDAKAALALASKAIEAAPNKTAGYDLRARIHSAERHYASAVADLGQLIRLDPKGAEAYYRRGRENFKAGRIDASLADFDQYVVLRPKVESRQWERGICAYYAKKYKQGAKQFELYQTYHDNDVENSTWRYLCMARTEGVAKARKVMLPIKNDTRVPMMKIFDLYRGKAKPEDVLAAARAGEPTKQQLHRRLFYAHLYLGLYFEVGGKTELAKKHIILAADKYMIEHYMGDVARIHAARFRKS